MIYFIVNLHFTDPSKVWETVPKHSRWMREHHRAGKIIAGGPLSDMSGAVGILCVESTDEAETIMQDEPFVCGGIATMTLCQWDPILHGCIGDKARAKDA
ncbi:MAG: YciI family protein [Acidiferrobacterales bacterium]